MAKKWTPALDREALRLDGEGRASREIAEVLSKRGKKVSHSLVAAKLKAAKERAAGAQAPAQAVQTPGPTVPAELLAPPDRTPMTPEGLVGHLTGLLRHQEKLVEAMTRDGDHAAAQRATKVAAQLAALLHKQQSRDRDEGEMLRVRASDIASAAERARSKLHDLVSRLTEERSKAAEAREGS